MESYVTFTPEYIYLAISFNSKPRNNTCFLISGLLKWIYKRVYLLVLHYTP